MLSLSIAEKHLNAVKYVHHYYYRQVCLMHEKLGDDAGNTMKDRCWQAYARRSVPMLAEREAGSLTLNEIARSVYLAMSSFGLDVQLAADNGGLDVLVSKCPDKASLVALGAVERVKCYETCLSMARSLVSVMNPHVSVELRERMPFGKPHCRFEYRLADDRYTLGPDDFPEIPVEVKYEVMSNFSVGAYCAFVATWARELGRDSADKYVEDTWNEVVRLASNDFSQTYGKAWNAEALADCLMLFWGAIGVKDAVVRNEGSYVALDIRNCGFGHTMAEWGHDFGITCRHTCDAIVKAASGHANIPPNVIFSNVNPPSGCCNFEICA